MSDKFITLKCQSCGGKLDVYDDMKRFACGYCGNEMLVQRRGGTVSLEKVVEVFEKVEISTNKATAEMAIARIGIEKDELVDKLTAMNDGLEKTLYVIGGAYALVVAPLCWYHMRWLWVVAIVTIPAGWGVYRYVKRHYAKTREIQKQIDEKTARLADIKKTAGFS